MSRHSLAFCSLPRLLAVVAWMVATLLLVAPGRGQCPQWSSEFAVPGVGGRVYAFAVHDDGTGPALYAGGTFSFAGANAAHNIARWDGSQWTQVGGGLEGLVKVLAVHDDGTGPALYAGGEFPGFAGLPFNGLVKWDGTSWTTVGGAVTGRVNAITSYGTGSNHALYIGGTFAMAGGVVVNSVARWNGSTWADLAGGVTPNSSVEALAVLPIGANSVLVVAGNFSSAGPLGIGGLARWNGTTWAPFGAGLGCWIAALAVYDEPGPVGPKLFAGGCFAAPGFPASYSIARWDGTAWSALGSGMSGSNLPYVFSLAVHDDGSGAGPALYAGGSFNAAGGIDCGHVAKWNGTTWSALGRGVRGGSSSDGAFALQSFDDGNGPALFAGGTISSADNHGVFGATRWRNGRWSALGTGSGLNGGVATLASYDDGSGAGPRLCAGGSFSGAGSKLVNGIAAWDGTHWSALGIGLTGILNTLVAYDDGLGGGPKLFASGGPFTDANGTAIGRIAQWDGSSWSAVGMGATGGGVEGWVHGMGVFDDGSGPKLHVFGPFHSIDGVPAESIASWNGIAWSALGSGLGGLTQGPRCLAVHDDGCGPALFVGGGFTSAGGIPVNNIAKWTGSAWQPVGVGTDGTITTLTSFDLGSGRELYAGGGFDHAGGVVARGLAKWSGGTWSALGAGTNGDVYDIEGFDDGSGPALFATGYFTSVGGLPAGGLAKWDGSVLSPVGGGLDEVGLALLRFDDGSGGGESLFLGGSFSSVGGVPSSGLAAWRRCGSVSSSRFCPGDGSLAPCPCANTGAETRGCASSALPGARVDALGRASISADSVVLRADGLTGSVAIFVQGAASHAPMAMDDGLSCLGGVILRIGATPVVGGGSAYPGFGAVPVSLRGQIPATGGTRYYQCVYRNAASFCTPAPTNHSSACRLDWSP